MTSFFLFLNNHSKLDHCISGSGAFFTQPKGLFPKAGIMISATVETHPAISCKLFFCL